jgi:hypothetical protein
MNTEWFWFIISLAGVLIGALGKILYQIIISWQSNVEKSISKLSIELQEKFSESLDSIKNLSDTYLRNQLTLFDKLTEVESKISLVQSEEKTFHNSCNSTHKAINRKINAQTKKLNDHERKIEQHGEAIKRIEECLDKPCKEV